MKIVLDRCSIFHSTSQYIYYIKYDKRKLKKYMRKYVFGPHYGEKYKKITIRRCYVCPPYATIHIPSLKKDINYSIHLPMNNKQLKEPIFIMVYYKMNKKIISTNINIQKNFITLYKEKP